MLNTLLESLAEGVVIINEKGRIVMINKRFAYLTGYEKPEVIGESLSIFLPDEMARLSRYSISSTTCSAGRVLWVLLLYLGQKQKVHVAGQPFEKYKYSILLH